MPFWNTIWSVVRAFFKNLLLGRRSLESNLVPAYMVILKDVLKKCLADCTKRHFPNFTHQHVQIHVLLDLEGVAYLAKCILISCIMKCVNLNPVTASWTEICWNEETPIFENKHIGPALMNVFIAAFSIFRVANKRVNERADLLSICIIGFQWWWQCC